MRLPFLTLICAIYSTPHGAGMLQKVHADGKVALDVEKLLRLHNIESQCEGKISLREFQPDIVLTSLDENVRRSGNLHIKVHELVDILAAEDDKVLIFMEILCEVRHASSPALSFVSFALMLARTPPRLSASRECLPP